MNGMHELQRSIHFYHLKNVETINGAEENILLRKILKMQYHKIYLASCLSTNERQTIINRKFKKLNSLNLIMENSICSAYSSLLQFISDSYSVKGSGAYNLYWMYL